MEAAAGVRLASCGPTAARRQNAWLMQFQADVLGVPVVVPEVSETTALGAAYLAGVATGTWTEQDVARCGARRRATSRRCPRTEREPLLAGMAPGTRPLARWAREA